ncbi:MAG: hypothetical protein RL885_27905 [Planctomycetota bacterium]
MKRRPHLGKTILGGVVGTLFITLGMYWVAPIVLGHEMDMATLIGERIGAGQTSGMILHILAGSLVFPLFYAMVAIRIFPGAPLTKGVLWGVSLWLFSGLIATPFFGGALFGGAIAVALFSLAGHLIYGAVQGAIAGPLREPRERPAGHTPSATPDGATTPMKHAGPTVGGTQPILNRDERPKA